MQDGAAPPQDASAASLAEKKRNKLGYHRTSVACVHCRRRKIRCLVDANDPSGRCQNCIRLKKDCNFYPVDQQPPNERQRRPVARGGSQPSTSPVPQPQAGGEAFAYEPPPMGYQAPMHGQVQIAPLDTNGFAAPHRAFTWDPAYGNSPMSPPSAMSETGAPGMWGGGPYSAGGDVGRPAQHFPPGFSPGRTDWQPMHSQQQQLPMNHAGGQVGQPVRSMSMSHDAQGMYGAGHMGGNAFYDATRGPPSLQTSTGSPATTASLSDATTAPGQSQPVMPYGLPTQTQWDPSKDFGAQAGAMVPGWYPDPTAIPSMPDDGSHAWQQQIQGQGAFKPA